MLISEIHLTNKYYSKIPSYLIHYLTHPDGIAYGITAIIIKNDIQYHDLDNFKIEFLHAIIVIVED
jgi:hypothetical protein